MLSYNPTLAISMYKDIKQQRRVFVLLDRMNHQIGGSISNKLNKSQKNIYVF